MTSPAPELLYGRHGTLAVYEEAQCCTGCRTMHFVMANSFGRTVCLGCDVAPPLPPAASSAAGAGGEAAGR